MPIPVRITPFLSPGCPGEMYAVLARLSPGCTPDGGRLHTCYSPVRRSPAVSAGTDPAAPRLACVKPAASVHPEPGSNSPLLVYIFRYSLSVLCCLSAPYIRFLNLSGLSDLTESSCLSLLLSCLLVLWHRCHCPSLDFRRRAAFRFAVAKLLPFSPLCKPSMHFFAKFPFLSRHFVESQPNQ